MQFADVLIFSEISPSMRDFVWGLGVGAGGEGGSAVGVEVD